MVQRPDPYMHPSASLSYSDICFNRVIAQQKCYKWILCVQTICKNYVAIISNRISLVLQPPHNGIYFKLKYLQHTSHSCLFVAEIHLDGKEYDSYVMFGCPLTDNASFSKNSSCLVSFFQYRIFHILASCFRQVLLNDAA